MPPHETQPMICAASHGTIPAAVPYQHEGMVQYTRCARYRSPPPQVHHGKTRRQLSTGSMTWQAVKHTDRFCSLWLQASPTFPKLGEHVVMTRSHTVRWLYVPYILCCAVGAVPVTNVGLHNILCFAPGTWTSSGLLPPEDMVLASLLKRPDGGIPPHQQASILPIKSALFIS